MTLGGTGKYHEREHVGEKKESQRCKKEKQREINIALFFFLFPVGAVGRHGIRNKQPKDFTVKGNVLIIKLCACTWVFLYHFLHKWHIL